MRAVSAPNHGMAMTARAPLRRFSFQASGPVVSLLNKGKSAAFPCKDAPSFHKLGQNLAQINHKMQKQFDLFGHTVIPTHKNITCRLMWTCARSLGKIVKDTTMKKVIALAFAAGLVTAAPSNAQSLTGFGALGGAGVGTLVTLTAVTFLVAKSIDSDSTTEEAAD